MSAHHILQQLYVVCLSQRAVREGEGS